MASKYVRGDGVDISSRSYFSFIVHSVFSFRNLPFVLVGRSILNELEDLMLFNLIDNQLRLSIYVLHAFMDTSRKTSIFAHPDGCS